jgi:hypothetical protein
MKRRKDNVTVLVTYPAPVDEMLALARLNQLRLRAAIMEREFVFARFTGLTRAETKEEFFGFTPVHIAAIRSRRKDGIDTGPFFCLHDGRTFDNAGRPQELDWVPFDATKH